MTTDLLFYLSSPTARMPDRAYEGDAGLDLYADTSVDLAPSQPACVFTGVHAYIPEGHVGLVCSRSGLAAVHGVYVLNSPGIIDSGYRGELKVILSVTSEPYHVAKGSKIAQLVVMKLAEINPRQTSSPPGEKSDRGHGGFGSSGH